jgi:hypothetical protein
LSASQVAGAAMMGIGIASMGIPIQAASNLMQQTKSLNIKTQRSHHRTQRRVAHKMIRRDRQSWSSLSVSNAVFGERRQRRRR